MGQVFAAEDQRLGRKVALKILPAESMKKAERVRRFEQEARTVSALNHPNIVTVYEIGQIDGTHYMATEYVEGHTLRTVLASPVSVTKALDIATQTAAALAAAHAAGIVHRDIKPENIMVRPDGYIKVLDFGLAKLAEVQTLSASGDDPTMLSALTSPGQIMGTYAYMSPEQARGLDVDARTDVWSLGTVLYEMLAGSTPFAAPTATDTLARVLERQPQPLAKAGKPVPAELQRILDCALAKDRDERYHTVADMALDLKQVRRDIELKESKGQTSDDAIVRPRGTQSLTWRLILGLAALLVLAGAVSWWPKHRESPSNQTPAATVLPQRELTYRVHVQKMKAGKPEGEEFLASPAQVFDSGWKIMLDFTSPQSGSLYVLDESPNAQGNSEFTVFFPLPQTNGGISQVAASQTARTGWARFGAQPGKETFWIIWSATPLSDVEQIIRDVSNPQHMGVIADTAQIAAIRELLTQPTAEKPEITTTANSRQTTIRGPAEVLISALPIEHR
jgi:serine/threonine protein kinase